MQNDSFILAYLLYSCCLCIGVVLQQHSASCVHRAAHVFEIKHLRLLCTCRHDTSGIQHADLTHSYKGPKGKQFNLLQDVGQMN